MTHYLTTKATNAREAARHYKKAARLAEVSARLKDRAIYGPLHKMDSNWDKSQRALSASIEHEARALQLEGQIQ